MTSVRLFPIYKPHHSLVAIINVTCTSTCRDQTNGVGFKKISAKPYCTRCDSDRFLKYIDISDLHEFASENPACLSHGRDIVLIIRFQHLPVIEDLGFLFFVPGEKFGSFTNTHLFYTIIKGFWNLTDIVQVFHFVKVMRIPGFRGCETEGAG
jgi:hypothetical protein